MSLHWYLVSNDIGRDIVLSTLTTLEWSHRNGRPWPISGRGLDFDTADWSSNLQEQPEVWGDKMWGFIVGHLGFA
ncbi:hypothetical protein IG631_23032 [Alternaria alternata]|nr:hypothetical protein IG631_23032 [Alternaria alternata]